MTRSAQAGITIHAMTVEECAEHGLRAPMVVEIDCDGIKFVAKVLLPIGVDTFGTGSSIPSAVTDLVEAMRAEASSLRLRRERLSPALVIELSTLDRMLAGPGAIQPYTYVGAPIATGATGPTVNTALSRNSYIPFPAAGIRA